MSKRRRRGFTPRQPQPVPFVIPPYDGIGEWAEPTLIVLLPGEACPLCDVVHDITPDGHQDDQGSQL